MLAGTPSFVHAVVEADLPAALAPSESANVAAIFAGEMLESRYVPAGAGCVSLGAVRLNAGRMGFDERAKGESTQLRCWFYDSSNDSYNLPVVNRRLQAIQQAEGREALEAMRKAARHAHVRIGLAHPFPDGRAFAMVNHVVFF